jgi:hypothetical protein
MFIRQFVFESQKTESCPQSLPPTFSLRPPIILSRVYGSVTNNNGFWIWWLVLLTPSLQSLLITINLQPNSSSSTAEDTLHSRSHNMTGFCFMTALLIQSQGGSIENTSIAQQWIYMNHTENTASSIVVYTVHCTAMGVIWLLPAYSLLRECVYRVVAQQRVCMSQHIKYWIKFCQWIYILGFNFIPF